MKKKNILPLVLLSVSFLLGSCSNVQNQNQESNSSIGDKGPTGDKGPNGENGLNGEDGKNGIDGAIILNGNGEPSTSLGKDGDLYIELDNGNLYRKEKGIWVIITNIYGEDGTDGSNGSSGSSGSDGKTAYSSSIIATYGGAVIPSKGSAFVGEAITFTFIPDLNNSLKEITINDEIITASDKRLVTNKETNVTTYTTTMIKNGFVVGATFLDENGKDILPIPTTGNVDFLVSKYTIYNDEFDLVKNQSPYYQFNENDLNEYYANIDFSANQTTLMDSLYERLNDGFTSLNYWARDHKRGHNITGYSLTDRDYETEPLTQEEVNSNQWNEFAMVDALYVDTTTKWDGDFNTYNREHIWAKSHGFSDYEDSPAGTDMHHLRLADPSTNSSHNNKYYDDTITPEYWAPPNKDDRGDLARAIFYMATKYSRYDASTNSPWLVLVENPNGQSGDASSTKDKPAEYGKLSTLIRWHQEDPVSEFELGRNNFVYNLQGNRNPFIDYPDLVSLLF